MCRVIVSNVCRETQSRYYQILKEKKTILEQEIYFQVECSPTKRRIEMTNRWAMITV